MSYSGIPAVGWQIARLCPRPPLTFSIFDQYDDARPESAPAHHPPSTVHVTKSTPTDIPARRSAQTTKVQRARIGGGDVLAAPAARHVGAGGVCAQDRYRVHLLRRGRHAHARPASTHPLIVCVVPPEPLPQRRATSHKRQSCCDGQLVAWPVCDGACPCELPTSTESRSHGHR
jgi:hypothetical protein